MNVSTDRPPRSGRTRFRENIHRPVDNPVYRPVKHPGKDAVTSWDFTGCTKIVHDNILQYQLDSIFICERLNLSTSLENS